MRPRINNLMEQKGKPQVRYYGRPPDSSTATGYSKAHLAQIDAFVKDCMS
jgi:2-oxoglutarate dehydrogenase complex dehydrogenase (E1) component-like enzyme